MNAITATDIRFKAADGYELAGRLIAGPAPRMAVLVSSGTGYPLGFYERIARFMAEHGAAVLTYDFRGIGQSAPDTLKGSPIDYPDWGRLDMPAALETLKAAAPDLPVFHIGHSIGGSFIGFMPNHADIAKHAFVSVGSGYWPHHHRSYRPSVLFFWFGFGPLHLMRHGFIKQGKLWTGTHLPPKVFKTWRRWCMTPDFFGSDLKSGKLDPHHYNDVTSPVRSWLFSDDPIATPRASQTVRNTLPNAHYETVLKTPADYGRPRIGHEGAVRKGMEPLWQEILEWFDQGVSTQDRTP
ncbi:alpha/beta fold hydrolase [Brevundimonas terrae]|uniref:Alpha/beta fold hydrolase n=1 Tax=Brevundimonas terrae TaxID=363631 RepID=A0ABN0YLB6_9CAUL|nr:alpha/beta fold hydrolase [Brevundimonas terrae]NIJ28065.1 putative alpha/beta hydrolase [Brevundimonas terrae]